jgi:hypothetical protein
VVAVEVSYSDQTLEWAAYEAALRQVPLTVVTVHQPQVGYWGAVKYRLGPGLLESDLKAAREQADKILGRIDAGASGGFAQIVLGTLGSQDAACQPRCPVVVIPAADR